MTNDKRRRRPASDRARKRAIRAHATEAGVAYSVAARHLDGGLEPTAATGRTVYPPSSDEHRWWLIALRDQRSYDRRVRDTRLAIGLPLGRAEHLVERFPATRGEPGTGTGPLYAGESRWAVVAMLYAVARHERPEVEPSAEELAFMADLGEDAAVDLACAVLDRTARSVVAGDRWRMWTRIESALAAAEAGPDRRDREAAIILGRQSRDLSVRSSVDGARHTLDALLVATDRGHAPGTRVRLLTRPYRGRLATIVGAHWSVSGPPTAYDVRPDGAAIVVTADPTALTLPEPDRSARAPEPSRS
jgi:hypothetical protein